MTLATVCLLPRGTEEGSTLEIDREDLQLVANTARFLPAVQFADAHRRQARRGGRVRSRRSRPAPACAARSRDPFRQEGGRAAVPVRARRAADRSRHAGDLGGFARSASTAGGFSSSCAKREEPQAPAPAGRRHQRNGAGSGSRADRATPSGRHARSRPRSCQSKLEADTWRWAATPGRCRRSGRLADWLLEFAEGRGRASRPTRSRWLNLCGFCLRPGFGFPGDDFRIEQARRIYAAGCASRTTWRTRSSGGSSGAASRADSIAISRRTSSSASPRRLLPAR